MADRIRPGVYFLDEAPEFELRDGVVFIHSRSGGVEFSMVVTRHQFLKGQQRSREIARQISENDPPIPFPRKG